MWCNAIYDENNYPVDVMFCWNFVPEHRKQETFFKLLNIRTDLIITPILEDIAQITDLYESGTDDVSQIVDLIHSIRRQFITTSKMFNQDLEENVAHEVFAPYIQSIAAWDDGKGPSATEHMTFQSILAFIGLEGTSVQGKIMVNSRRKMPRAARNLVTSLVRHSQGDGRYGKLTEGQIMTVKSAKNELLSSYHSFVMSHKKRVSRYLAYSKGSASGSLRGNEVQSTFVENSNERLQEISTFRKCNKSEILNRQISRGG